jgi:hypothetical protein
MDLVSLSRFAHSLDKGRSQEAKGVLSEHDQIASSVEIKKMKKLPAT